MPSNLPRGRLAIHDRHLDVHEHRIETLRIGVEFPRGVNAIGGPA